MNRYSIIAHIHEIANVSAGHVEVPDTGFLKFYEYEGGPLISVFAPGQWSRFYLIQDPNKADA